MKISIVTPTVRPLGLEEIKKSLRKQTFTEFEWIVCCPTEIEGPFIYLRDPPKKEGEYWTIYSAYNSMIREAKGELVVTWQDFTYAKPDTLERFWQHYQDEPKTIVTAVGNKYTDNTWMVETWKDPRINNKNGSYYPCFYNDIELNLSAFPRESFFAVGGFDEYLNRYSSLCGLDVLDRLNMLGGYDFKIDQSILSFSTEHGRLPNWEENSPFHGAYDTRRKEYLKSPILEYLKP